LSDFIVSAMAQVEALSAALEIFRPVEISFWVVARDDWVARSDWRAVIAEGFTRILGILLVPSWTGEQFRDIPVSHRLYGYGVMPRALARPKLLSTETRALRSSTADHASL
jgi:hypothetical protein